MRNRHGVYRVLSGFLAITYFGTQSLFAYSPEKSFWAERKKSREQRSGTASNLLTSAGIRRSPDLYSQNVSLLSALPQAVAVNSSSADRFPSGFLLGSAGDSAMPASVNSAITKRVLPYGTLLDAHFSKTPDAPMIVHIQDAHGIEEAQKNVAAMIQELSQNQGVSLVGLEAAQGEFNLAPYRNWPDISVTRDVAEYFLKSGRIGGPEFAGITAPTPLTLWGVEDTDLYLANVQALKDANAFKPEFTKILSDLKKDVFSLKDTIYSQKLKDFDRHFQSYQDQKEGLGSYVRFLTGASGVDSSGPYPNLRLLVKALDSEDTLDFKRVEKERLELVELLASQLPKQQLDLLVQRSLQYRTGQLVCGEYQRFLKSLCHNHNIPLDDLSQLSDYIEYVLLAERVDRNKLLEELAEAERDVQSRLATTSEQKKLVSVSRHLALLSKLAAQAMTPDDWTSYEKERDDIHKIATAVEALSVQGRPVEHVSLGTFLKPAEDFCRIAVQRNASFVENLSAQMKLQKTPTAVLVAGGFHSEGLINLLRKKDMSYVVVTPKITEVPRENNYLDVFARDPLPLEKLFSGQTIFLNFARLTAAKPTPGFEKAATALGNESLATKLVLQVLKYAQAGTPDFDSLVTLTNENARRASLALRVASKDITATPNFAVVRHTVDGSAGITLAAEPGQEAVAREKGGIKNPIATSQIGGKNIYHGLQFQEREALPLAADIWKGIVQPLTQRFLKNKTLQEDLFIAGAGYMSLALSVPWFIPLIFVGFVFLHIKNIEIDLQHAISAGRLDRGDVDAVRNWKIQYGASLLVNAFFLHLLLLGPGILMTLYPAMMVSIVWGLPLVGVFGHGTFSPWAFSHLMDPSSKWAFAPLTVSRDTSEPSARLKADFYTEDGFDLALYVSLIRHLRDTPEVASAYRLRMIAALKKGRLGEELIAIAEERMKAGFPFTRARLDTLMEGQSETAHQALVELINNGWDAMGDSIGRFGRGLFQAVGQLKEDGDSLTFMSVPEEEKRMRYSVVFRKVDGVIRVNFKAEELSHTGTAGTEVILRMKKGWDVDATERFLGRKLGRSRRGLLLRGNKDFELANHLESLATLGGESPSFRLGNRGVQYWISADGQEIHVKDSGHGLAVLAHPGTQQEMSVLLESVPVPYVSTNRSSEELQRALANKDWSANGDEILVERGAGPQGSVQFQIGGTEVETESVKGVHLSPEIVLDLPTACDQKESRDRLRLDDPVTVAALKEVTDEVLKEFIARPSEIAPIVNALFAVYRVFQKGSRPRSSRPEDDLAVYLKDQLGGILPTLDRNAWVLIPSELEGRLADDSLGKRQPVVLDGELFKFNPETVKGEIIMSGRNTVWKVNLKDNIYIRVGGALLLNRSVFDFLNQSDRVFPGKGPLILNLLFGFWIGYGEKTSYEDELMGSSLAAKAVSSSDSNHALQERAQALLSVAHTQAPNLDNLMRGVIPRHLLLGGDGNLVRLERYLAVMNFVEWGVGEEIGDAVEQFSWLEEVDPPVISPGGTAYSRVGRKKTQSIFRWTDGRTIVHGMDIAQSPLFDSKGFGYVWVKRGGKWSLLRLKDGKPVLENRDNVEQTLFDGNGNGYVISSLGSLKSLHGLKEGTATALLVDQKNMTNVYLSDEGSCFVSFSQGPKTIVQSLTNGTNKNILELSDWTRLKSRNGIVSITDLLNHNKTYLLTGGKAIPVWEDGDDVSSEVFVGPHGQAYGVSRSDSRRVFAAVGGQVKAIIEGYDFFNDPRFSSDGSAFFIALKGDQYSLILVNKGIKTVLLQGKEEIERPSFDPNGNAYVWVDEALVRVLYRCDAGGSTEKIIEIEKSEKIKTRGPLFDSSGYGYYAVRNGIDSSWSVYSLTTQEKLLTVNEMNLMEVSDGGHLFFDGSISGLPEDKNVWLPFDKPERGIPSLHVFWGGVHLDLKIFGKHVGSMSELNLGYAVTKDNEKTYRIRRLDSLEATIAQKPGDVHRVFKKQRWGSINRKQKIRAMQNLIFFQWRADEIETITWLLPFSRGETLKGLSKENRDWLTRLEGQVRILDRKVVGEFLDNAGAVLGNDEEFNLVVKRWLSLFSSDDGERALALSRFMRNSSLGWDSFSVPLDADQHFPPLVRYLSGEQKFEFMTPDEDRQGVSPHWSPVPLSSLAGLRANTQILSGDTLSIDMVREALPENGFPATENEIRRNASAGAGNEWLRDNIQNADKALIRSGSKDPIDVTVSPLLGKDKVTLRVATRDRGEGMDLHDVLNFLLPLDESSNRAATDRSKGFFGRGWYKNLSGADKVQFTTGKKGSDQHLFFQASKINGQWMVTHFEERGGDYTGTEMVWMKDYSGSWEEFQSQGELEAAIFADDLLTYVGVLGNDREIYFKGKKVSDPVEEVAAVGWAEGERIRLVQRKSMKTGVIQSGYYVEDLGQTPDLYRLLPLERAEVWRNKGVTLDLAPSTPLSRERAGLSQMDIHGDRLSKGVLALDLKFRAIELDYALPVDYLYRSHHLAKNISPQSIQLARKINQGNWSDINADEVSLLGNSDFMAQVLAQVKVGKTEMSMEDLRMEFLRRSQSHEGFKDLVDSPHLPPSFQRVLKAAIANQSSGSLARFTREEDTWEYQKDPLTHGQKALADFISGFMTPWLRKKGGSDAQAIYKVSFGNGKLGMARMGKGWISLNKKDPSVMNWLSWATNPSTFTPDESYAIAWDILETVVHENVHAYEGTNEESHNDAFKQRMLSQFLELVELGVAPEKWALGQISPVSSITGEDSQGRATSQWGLKLAEWIGSKLDPEHGREWFGARYKKYAGYIEWIFGANVAFWGFMATLAFAGGPMGWAIAPAVGVVYGILFVASHFIPKFMAPVTKVNVGILETVAMGLIYGVLIGGTPFLLGAVPLLGVPEFGVQAAGILWGLAGFLHPSIDQEKKAKLPTRWSLKNKTLQEDLFIAGAGYMSLALSVPWFIPLIFVGFVFLHIKNIEIDLQHAISAGRLDHSIRGQLIG
ncbi:MAG: hypothetical protein IPN90_04575 [Elusimicrobia bacterium]|nr:hypothetical protein [Elusimicrobiota bacterium]